MYCGKQHSYTNTTQLRYDNIPPTAYSTPPTGVAFGIVAAWRGEQMRCSDSTGQHIAASLGAMYMYHVLIEEGYPPQ
jgi:hypothetical protein